MKGGFSAPGDYIYFKSQVPLHKFPIGTKQWIYYDFGPKVVPPLICLPGTAGTADVYYKQIMALSMKGYRVISVDIPHVWNSQEWVQAFEKFLDLIDVHHIHLYGTSLGGFLALLFAQHRPRRVKSLVLSNAFLETKYFAAAMPWAPVVRWTPSFLLKRYVLTGIPSGPHEPFIADSVDFVVAQVETLSREDLASRLTLTSDDASNGPLMLSDSMITIIDTNDKCAIPQQLKDEVSEKFPGARKAYIKSGGDFPFLSRPDEINLHLKVLVKRLTVNWMGLTEVDCNCYKSENTDTILAIFKLMDCNGYFQQTTGTKKLHLRRVGVEAREDLVPGIPKPGDDDGGSGSGGGGGGGSSEPRDDREGTDDSPNENGSKSNLGGSSSNLGQPPLVPENHNSHGSDNQPLGGTTTDGEYPFVPILLEASCEKKVVLATSFLHFWLKFFDIYYRLPFSLLTLYIINNKHHPKIQLSM